MGVRSTMEITREDAISELERNSTLAKILQLLTDEQLASALEELCTYNNFMIVDNYEGNWHIKYRDRNIE